MAGELKSFGDLHPIKAEVTNIKGEKRVLTCEKITSAMTADLQKAAETFKSSGIALYAQMAIYFGGKKEDYFDLDARLVMQVVQWMTEQMKDPT